MTKTKHLPKQKRIALVAHDGRKQDLLSRVKFNKGTLSGHFLLGTGTTGRLITDETGSKKTALDF
jgi:methylglyoxal synthase